MNIRKYTLLVIGSSLLTTPAMVSAELTSEETSVDTSEAAKKPKKITDRRDPDFVRCRSEPVIGSRVKKKRICMTNRQWKQFNAEGNRRANEFVKDHQSGSTSN
ncbi:hypothetical protein [Parasphingorhabdus cellanae]|uniref:Uncharacterized protein n=1 Tax=Parasphingorhabdus cellanae TaxID=2806553 RepID=A0ABX7T617_9SPHN|nr:hypothetical protein [Parasphingorhabdus cellanae]QTD56971.1 hypothetical protein J4G78_05225 [Parasphingorhabdus cellanae]